MCDCEGHQEDQRLQGDDDAAGGAHVARARNRNQLRFVEGALDIAGLNRLSFSADVRLIPIRCLGSMNVIWIKDALSQGMDGVFLLGCKHGDDYQCHFVKGSELAEIRMKKIGDALSSLALEEERVAQFQVAIDEYNKIPQIIDEFAAQVEEMGTNTFKGF